MLYANANEIDRELARPIASRPSSTAGSLSRLQATIETVRERLDDFDATARRPRDPGVRRRALELVRAPLAPRASGTATRPRSRRCATCLLTVAKLLAPFCPFVADEIYDNLDGTEPSVHLCDFPTAGARDLELEQAMATARETVRLGLAARAPGEAQGPPAAARRRRRRDRRASARRSSGWPRSSARSSTCASCGSSPQADELGEVELKPNYRTLGPRFGKQMPLVAAAIAGLDAGPRGGDAARRRHGRDRRSAATTTSSPPTTCSSR